MKTMHVLLEEQADRLTKRMLTDGELAVATIVLRHPLSTQLAALVTDKTRRNITSRTDKGQWLKHLENFLHCLVEFRDHNVAVMMDDK